MTPSEPKDLRRAHRARAFPNGRRLPLVFLVLGAGAGCGRIGFQAWSADDAGAVPARNASGSDLGGNLRSDGAQYVDGTATDAVRVDATTSDAAGLDAPGGDAAALDASAGGPTAGASWAVAFGNAAYQEAFAAAYGPRGEIVLAGHFEGTVDFGPFRLVSAGDQDIFVVRVDPADGTVIAAFSFGGPGLDTAWGVAMDDAGQYYVAGSTEGNLDLGSGPIPGRGVSDAVLLAFDAGGSLRWGHVISGTGLDNGRAVVANHSGVFFAGAFENTVNFAGTNLTANGNVDAFVARFDTGGSLMWVRGFGGNRVDVAWHMAAAGDNLLLSGWLGGNCSVLGVVTVGAPLADLFVTQFDAAGAAQWVYRSQGTGEELGMASTSDALGNVYTIASFNDEARFGADTYVTPDNQRDIAIVALDPAGALRWSQHYTGLGSDDGRVVALTPSGDLFVGGSFSNDLRVNTTNLSSAGGQDGFVARLSNDGNLRWIREFGGTGTDNLWNGFTDDFGRLYGVGRFNGDADVLGARLTTSGGFDALVLRLVDGP